MKGTGPATHNRWVIEYIEDVDQQQVYVSDTNVHMFWFMQVSGSVRGPLARRVTDQHKVDQP